MQKIPFDDIRARVSLSTHLGTNDKTICCPLPGHEDKRPSCSVDHNTNLWYCFSCTQGGDVISLVMEQERLRDRMEAGAWLCGQYGIPMEECTPEWVAKQAQQDRIQKARAYAVEYYQGCLWAHGQNLAYLQGRGLSDRVIKAARLGCASSHQSLAAALRDSMPDGLSFEDFAAAGLLLNSGKGYFDWLEGYITIPQYVRGKIVNISGRATGLVDDAQKYRHLKGVDVDHFYNEDALASDTVWLFEGHPDALSGCELRLPAVGVIGTSGMKHPEKLARVKDLYICPDQDKAGRAAAERWVADIGRVAPDCHIKIVRLPDGHKDFNEWLIAHPDDREEALGVLKAGAKTPLEFAIEALTGPDGLDKVWPLLLPMTDTVRESWLRKIRQVLPDIQVPTLKSEFKAWKKAIEDAARDSGERVVKSVDFSAPKIVYYNQSYSVKAPYHGHVCLLATVSWEDKASGTQVEERLPVLIESQLKEDDSQPLGFKYIASRTTLSYNAGTTIPSDNVINGGDDRGFAWDGESVEAFLSGTPEAPKTGELVKDIAALFGDYLWFPDPAHYELFAIWTMGTYLFRVFGAYPYLVFNGSKGSGKSNTLRLFKNLCFNGSSSVNSSLASVFRTAHESGGTLIFDEVEQFNDPKNPNIQDLKEVLQSGYKPGYGVDRMEKDPSAPSGFRRMTYDIYCPKIFGGIHTVGDIMEDRGILVQTVKADPEHYEGLKDLSSDMDAWQPACREFRSRLYAWAMTQFVRVHRCLKSLPKGAELVGRERELWEPILAIAALADIDNGNEEAAVFGRMKALAMQKIERKKKFDRKADFDDELLFCLDQVIAGHEVTCIGFGSLSAKLNVYEIFPLIEKLEVKLREQGFCRKRNLGKEHLRDTLEQSGILTDPAKQWKRRHVGGLNRWGVEILPERLKSAIARANGEGGVQ